MKKRFLFFAGCCIINTITYCQANDCSKFRKGEFACLDSANQVVLVKRNNRRQHEINQSTGEHTVAKISCEYELKRIRTNNKLERKMNGSVTKVIISSVVNDDSYEYTCGCEDPKLRTVKGIMKRIIK
jgi:arylamine N-acetyltransferase